MTIYIALLRGINVGTKNRIKMADLQATLEAAGLGKVETYIQSGNLIFESSQREEALQAIIEGEIKRVFCVTTIAVLRSAAELGQLIQICPFTPQEINQAETANTEGESLYIALLTKTPAEEKIAILNKYATPEDAYQIRGRDVYLLLRHSIRKSKLAGNLERLGSPVTIRNWNTIQKLEALVKARNKPD